MLFIIQATALLALPHSVGLKSVWVMVAAAWLTWTMALSEVANAWWGPCSRCPLQRVRQGPPAANHGKNWFSNSPISALG